MKPIKLTLTDTKAKAVIITVRGQQDFEDSEPDATELVTEGVLRESAEDLLLSYEEDALSGMEGTTTTFAIKGDQVVLTRTGSVNSQMIFQQGRQHTSQYQTPYGILAMDIETSLLSHDITPAGGHMDIRYSIAVERTVTGRNCFQISVQEK